MTLQTYLLLSVICIPLIASQRCTPQENKEMRHRCIDKYSKSTDVCNGRGDCNCGICECHSRRGNSAERYSGQYCNCDDYSCTDYHEGIMCGANGECVCGSCTCSSGYQGRACECPTGNRTCIGSNGKVCSGVGACQCGSCKCKKPFTGEFCESCPDCAGKCSSYKECVLCRVFHTGPYSTAECASKCSTLPISTVDNLKVDTSKEKKCTFKDEDECSVYFSYALDSSAIVVQKTAVCNSASPSSYASRFVPLNGIVSVLTTWLVLAQR